MRPPLRKYLILALIFLAWGQLSARAQAAPLATGAAAAIEARPAC